MVQKGFNPTSSIENKSHPLYGKTCADLKVNKVPIYKDGITIKEASEELEKGVVAVPVVEDGQLLGIVTRDSLSKGLMMENLKDSDLASKAFAYDFVVIDYNTTDVSAVDSLLKID